MRARAFSTPQNTLPGSPSRRTPRPAARRRAAGRAPTCYRCARRRPIACTRTFGAGSSFANIGSTTSLVDLRRVVAAVLGDAEQHRRHRLRARPGLRIREAEIVLHQRLGLLRRHFQPRRGGARGRFKRAAILWVMMYSALNCGRAFDLVPVVENLLHQPGSRISACGPSWPSASGPAIAGAVAPGADVELVERIAARSPSLGHALEACDLAERARPVVLLLLDEAERRVLDRDHAGDVGHALASMKNTIGPPVEWP